MPYKLKFAISVAITATMALTLGIIVNQLLYLVMSTALDMHEFGLTGLFQVGTHLLVFIGTVWFTAKFTYRLFYRWMTN